MSVSPSRKTTKSKAKSNQGDSASDLSRMGEPLPREAGRPPVRRNEIFDEIRSRIVRGEFVRGERIWTMREICRRFDASPATAHSVLRDLSKAGFIQTCGARGTFVTDNPPFLHRYAVVCFDGGNHEELYYRAIRQEAIRLRDGGADIDVIDLPRKPLRTDNVFELEKRVERRLYRGLIFSQAPEHLLGTAILESPEVQRVFLSTNSVFRPVNAFKSSTSESNKWQERALQKALELGCRRVALISHSWGNDQIQQFYREVGKLGLQTERIWSHCLHHSSKEESGRITELLFSLPPAKRPDILLIGNDNFTDQVTHSLKQIGIRIPVISHCNYPLLPEAHVPVIWLGYDIPGLLLQSIRFMEKNENVNKPLTHSLCFEEELPTSLKTARA